MTGLRPVDGGYGVLLLASEDSGCHATFVTWDVAWTEAIADVAQQVLDGVITREAGVVDLTPELLSDKAAALFVGWLDDSHRPGSSWRTTGAEEASSRGMQMVILCQIKNERSNGSGSVRRLFS